MAELLTAAQMRAIEQAAIGSGQVTGLELMERAGRGVVDAIFAEWPQMQAAPRKAVVLCGPGNNGGDGFVVARLLHDWGWTVEVFLYGDAGALPPDARANYDRWSERGEVTALTQAAFEQNPPVPDADLIIDALFGIGLSRPVDLQLGDLSPAEEAGPKRVAIDVPSGLCADSGQALGDISHVVAAHLTVTFHRRKPGHLLAPGPDLCGKVRVAGIGLTAPGGAAGPPRLRVVEPDETVLTSKHPAAHKYTHGHALILSGPMGRSGAARLAARAALRVGAGLVTVAAPGSAMMECACQLTAIMLRRCDDGAALAEMLEDTRLNALCLGPGLGLDRVRDLVPVALGAGRAVVLDADALTAYADAPESLFAMLHDGAILTPHAGEFARLFPDLAEKLTAQAPKGPAYSKLDAARDAAMRAGCTVLFKGPDTVIAAPDGRAVLQSATGARAAPWLATAGSGDVLAGLIAGLLARGYDPMCGAETAAWLHLEAALQFGPGLIAEDIPEALPDVFRSLHPENSRR